MISIEDKDAFPKFEYRKYLRDESYKNSIIHLDIN